MLAGYSGTVQREGLGGALASPPSCKNKNKLNKKKFNKNNGAKNSPPPHSTCCAVPAFLVKQEAN